MWINLLRKLDQRFSSAVPKSTPNFKSCWNSWKLLSNYFLFSTWCFFPIFMFPRRWPETKRDCLVSWLVVVATSWLMKHNWHWYVCCKIRSTDKLDLTQNYSDCNHVQCGSLLWLNVYCPFTFRNIAHWLAVIFKNLCLTHTRTLTLSPSLPLSLSLPQSLSLSLF